MVDSRRAVSFATRFVPVFKHNIPRTGPAKEPILLDRSRYPLANDR